MRKKKELTEAEKRDLAMKYEVAEELGLLEKVERCGWRGLTSRESASAALWGQEKRRSESGQKRTKRTEWTPKRTESGQGVDRQWTGVWTAERHFLSIRIPACI